MCSRPFRAFLASTAALGFASCQCANLPSGTLFTCQGSDDCVSGSEYCAEDGFCRPLVGADASSGKDAEVVPSDGAVEPPDSGAAFDDAGVADAATAAGDVGLADAAGTSDAGSPADAGEPGLDASPSLFDASTLPPDAAAPGFDAAAPGLDAAAPALDASTAPGPDAGLACNPVCTGGKVCVINVCQCPSGTVECGGLCVASCDGTTGDCAANHVCQGGCCVPCGGDNEPCCGTACNSGFTCSGGQCQACGSAGQPCCSGACGAGLGCIGNKCQRCGALDEPCCEGAKCSAGTCHAGTCLKCGALDQPCCPGSSCTDGTSVCRLGKCAPCGAPSQPCCDGSGCSATNCCNAFGFCVAPNSDCDPTSFCCHISVDPKCPKSCVSKSTGGAQCGGLGDACCQHTPGTGPTRLYCSETGTVCNVLSNKCEACGDPGELCCGGEVCFKSGCGSGPTKRCEVCGTAGTPCCPGLACSEGCCDPVYRVCVTTGTICTGLYACDEAGRCAPGCGNLSQKCCEGTLCLPDYDCSDSCQ